MKYERYERACFFTKEKKRSFSVVMLFLYRFYFFLEEKTIMPNGKFIYIFIYTRKKKAEEERKKDEIHARKWEQKKFIIVGSLQFPPTSCARNICDEMPSGNLFVSGCESLLKLICNLFFGFYGLITIFWRFLWRETLNNCLHKTQINITKVSKTKIKACRGHTHRRNFMLKSFMFLVTTWPTA